MSFTIDYKDKVVLVTGVSSGIGLGTAIEFAKAGAHVAGCSRKAAGDTCAVAFRKAVCTEERWQYNLDLNLASHWRLSKLCKPYLEKSGEGVILLMTSNHAFGTIPGCFPYSVTKTAITGLVRNLAIEWGPAIRTVGVAPGFIDTAGNDTWFDSFPDAEQERRRTINLHPVKRIGTVDEVGALCVYLASPKARFISGTTILMDGGRSALMQDEF